MMVSCDATPCHSVLCLSLCLCCCCAPQCAFLHTFARGKEWNKMGVSRQPFYGHDSKHTHTRTRTHAHTHDCLLTQIYCGGSRRWVSISEPTGEQDGATGQIIFASDSHTIRRLLSRFGFRLDDRPVDAKTGRRPPFPRNAKQFRRSVEETHVRSAPKTEALR